DGAEVACDQKDDIVEVGVVIETTDPRLVRRAGLSGRRQRQDSGSQNKTDQAAQNHDREIKSAPGGNASKLSVRGTLGPGANDLTMSVWTIGHGTRSVDDLIELLT